MSSEQWVGAGRTAVVIGASMGGLLAARALAEHYEQVTLLERDVLPHTAEHRKGTPQSRHAHAVLVRGLEIMEGYFPGLTANAAAGAPQRPARGWLRCARAAEHGGRRWREWGACDPTPGGQRRGAHRR